MGIFVPAIDIVVVL